jgi:hypothetical protein
MQISQCTRHFAENDGDGQNDGDIDETRKGANPEAPNVELGCSTTGASNWARRWRPLFACRLL